MIARPENEGLGPGSGKLQFGAVPVQVAALSRLRLTGDTKGGRS